MIRELKDTYSYPRVVALISVLSFISGIAVCFLGELLIPFASAFLAILFLFEKPNKRILSYACPIASITLSVFVKGWVALVAVEYVVIALIIAFCYKKSLSKAEASIYMTLTIAVFVFISLYISAAVALGSFSFAGVEAHYVKMLLDFKEEFVVLLSEFTMTSGDGAVQNVMSVEDATAYFNLFINEFIALVAIFAFLITGLTLKFYTKLVLRYSKYGILKKFAHFIPSNFCAYVFIVSALLNALSSDSSKFGIVLLNANAILTIVFAYMGLRYILLLCKQSQRRSIMYFLLVAAFLSLPEIVPTIISYLGAWVVIGTNSHNKVSND